MAGTLNHHMLYLALLRVSPPLARLTSRAAAEPWSAGAQPAGSTLPSARARRGGSGVGRDDARRHAVSRYTDRPCWAAPLPGASPLLAAARHQTRCESSPGRTAASVRAAWSTEGPFVESLVAYWDTVSDLAQRQEHGGHRDAEPLTHEDARRLRLADRCDDVRSAPQAHSQRRGMTRSYPGVRCGLG